MTPVVTVSRSEYSPDENARYTRYPVTVPELIVEALQVREIGEYVEPTVAARLVGAVGAVVSFTPTGSRLTGVVFKVVIDDTIAVLGVYVAGSDPVRINCVDMLPIFEISWSDVVPRPPVAAILITRASSEIVAFTA